MSRDRIHHARGTLDRRCDAPEAARERYPGPAGRRESDAGRRNDAGSSGRHEAPTADYAEYGLGPAPEARFRLSRRTLALRIALASVLVRAHGLAWAGSAHTPTPSTGRGPFYPTDTGARRGPDLVGSRGAPAGGQLLEVTGKIRDTDGATVSTADLVVWQADPKGIYDHPDALKLLGGGELDPVFGYWSKVEVDESGTYRFRTAEPGRYRIAGVFRPRHVHMEITSVGHRRLPTEMHFDGDPYAATDTVTTLAQHELLKVTPEAAPDIGREWRRARFDIVLRRH